MEDVPILTHPHFFLVSFLWPEAAGDVFPSVLVVVAVEPLVGGLYRFEAFYGTLYQLFINLSGRGGGVADVVEESLLHGKVQTLLIALFIRLVLIIQEPFDVLIS